MISLRFFSRGFNSRNLLTVCKRLLDEASGAEHPRSFFQANFRQTSMGEIIRHGPCQKLCIRKVSQTQMNRNPPGLSQKLMHQ